MPYGTSAWLAIPSGIPREPAMPKMLSPMPNHPHRAVPDLSHRIM